MYALHNSGFDDLDRDSLIAALDTRILVLVIEVDNAKKMVQTSSGTMQGYWMKQEMKLRDEVQELRVEKQHLRVEKQRLRADSKMMIEQLVEQGLIGTPVFREAEKENNRIEEGALFFVNRENAVSQLRTIHQSNYYRAASGNGTKWVIPICDDFFGMGKSRLAKMYIERCQATAVSSPQTSMEVEKTLKFRAILHQARTVHIIFKAAELQYEMMFEQTLLQKLRSALIPLFKVAPVCLYKSYASTDLLLSALVAEAGPLFVALDEIGSAFDIKSKSDRDRRDLFLSFCEKVLRSWLLVPGLFFLVLGRGSFLNYVGYRPGGVKMQRVSPFSFKRLSLQLLRSNSIIEIMKNTFVGETTLFNYYKLSPESAEVVAKRLHAQTTGNPRHLLDAFLQCKTYNELMEYNGSFVIEDYSAFSAYVSNYKDVVDFLFSMAESKSVVNLMQEMTFQERSTPYDIIANNVLIAWEGKLEAANLVASPTIIEFMATYYLSFREYLKLINRLLDGPFNFSEAFEIILMKRLQEIFAGPSRPKDVLPSFFDSPKFGRCEDLVFCDTVRRMGKVTSVGLGKRLLDLTVNTKAWSSLISEMDSFQSLCLKPLPLSASSDVIFAGNVVYGSSELRLTVGVAAKNYKEKVAGLAVINEECTKFDDMFVGSNPKGRLNVLLFCCTKYGKDTIELFGDKNFFVLATDKYPFIDEVIILDLSTTAKRATFFGLAPGDVLNECIDRVIAKDTPYTAPWIDNN